MTAQLRPEEPKFQTPSEEEVWTRLRDTLPDDAVLIAGLRITDEDKDHEADLVVLLPEVGIVVLEVKGGSVSYDGDVWSQRSAGRQEADRPRRAGADDEVRVPRLRRRATRAGHRGHVAWAHACGRSVLRLPRRLRAARLPAWALHDRDDHGPTSSRAARRQRRARQPGQARRRRTTTSSSSCEILAGRWFTRVRRERGGRGACRRAPTGSPMEQADASCRSPGCSTGSRCAVAPAAARRCSRCSRREQLTARSW